MRTGIYLWLATLVLVGCAGQWVRVSLDTIHRTDRYEVTLPAGWVKRIEEDRLVLSRDGPDLQKIVIVAAAHDKAFRLIEEGSAADMLPSELSAKFVAELKKESPDGLPSLVIEISEPARIGSRDGFHVVANYRNSDGIRYRLEAFGASSEKGYLSISYTAPVIHYFHKDIQAFEQTFQSLSLL